MGRMRRYFDGITVYKTGSNPVNRQKKSFINNGLSILPAEEGLEKLGRSPG
jgi:hypothetical protein